jgi:galactonate dehydratase
LKAVREAVGDEIDILLDFHGRVTPQMAIQFAKAFEPDNPLFIEEPVQSEVPDSMAQVKRATHIPIATGERLFSRWDFRRILETEAASLLQPDACHAGGISEVRKIGTMAEAYYAGLAPHNPYGPVSTAPVFRLISSPNLSSRKWLILKTTPPCFPSRTITHRDGYIPPPTRPGIGVEVDEIYVAKHQPDFYRYSAKIAWFRYVTPMGACRLVTQHDSYPSSFAIGTVSR